MKLRILSTGSKGNCYLLTDSQGRHLLLEAGVHIDKIKQAVDFKIGSIDACLLTHEHMDHAKSAKKLCAMGVPLIASPGTMKAIDVLGLRFSRPMTEMQSARCGDYRVKTFGVKHDAAQPLGYYLNHPEMGNLLFVTDTKYVEHKFPDMDYAIVEANYDDDILAEKAMRGGYAGVLKNRIMESHMSIDTMIGFLKSNNTSRLKTLIVCHLSDSNSHEENFIKRIEKDVGCAHVVVADSGMELEINKRPF